MEHGQCRICGAIGPLSFEHVPPEAAFNDRGVLLANLKHHFDEGELRNPRKMRMRLARKGAGGHTLCQPCNNKTGGDYGKAYVWWAEQGMAFRYAGVKGPSLSLPFHVFPGRLAKQIMCMFASACGPGLFEKAPELTRFVLNRDHTGIPSQFRIYCFLISLASYYSRQSGITGLISGIGDPGTSIHTFSEICFPPFGYILTIDSRPIDTGLLDITFFAQSRFQDFRTLHLPMPVRAVNSYFPGDFRTAEEWNAAIDKAEARRDYD